MRRTLRTVVLFTAAAAVVVGSRPAAAVDPLDPSAPCSVFDAAPCTPSFCGVFGAWPCVPSLPSLGRDLRLTIASRNTEGAGPPKGPINSLQELFAALRTCWEPPPLQQVPGGMEMSVRFSFKRTGELIGVPRVTYSSADADSEVKRVYGEAIDAALARCSPMPFSEKMGAAIAGRPLSIRFVDNRKRGSD